MNRIRPIILTLFLTASLSAQNLNYSLNFFGALNELSISTNPFFSGAGLNVVALETAGVSGGDQINFTYSSDFQFSAIETPTDWFNTQSSANGITTLTWKYGGSSSATNSEVYDFADGWTVRFTLLPFETPETIIETTNLEVNSFLRVTGAVNFVFNGVENFDASVVPEPRYTAAILMGFVGLLIYRRRLNFKS